VLLLCFSAGYKYVTVVCAENPSVRLMLRTRLLCCINCVQESCTVDHQKKQQILVSYLGCI